MVRKIGKAAKYVYVGGCIGDEICELLELAAVVKLESWRARASTKSGQRPTPNIGLFGFCWILEIRRAFVHWKFRRRITAIVYGGSFRRNHAYLP